MDKIKNGNSVENVYYKENGRLADNGNCEDTEKKVMSSLAYIECNTSNPLELFKQWHSEAKESDLVSPNAFCFSTSTKEGKVSSRHLLLRQLDEDGFVIMTDSRSKKVKELIENPVGSISFLWCYRKNGRTINRQVRIDGDVIELDENRCMSLYKNEPLYCKIRSHICFQGKNVNWSDLKETHNRLLEEVLENDRVLEMPDHVVAFKLVPRMMEFYYAFDTHIGDRLMFLAQDNNLKEWQCKRIAA